MIELIRGDCMNYMKNLPDKVFDLAIVDPDYGIGENWKKDRKGKFYKHNSTYKNKSIPKKEYFNELSRASKNQIIWGDNYYTDYFPATNSWIVWDKGVDYITQHFSEGEMAWHSFNIPLRIYAGIWNGFIRCEKIDKIHPHQKPIALYKWLLKNYAKEGDKILDTHLGSGSSAIAAFDGGFDFVGIEIDEEYFNAAKKRFDNHKAQLKLF